MSIENKKRRWFNIVQEACSSTNKEDNMKFGTGYAYWGTEWKCDYIKMVNKVADIGFDILEIGADHLYHMDDGQIDALKAEGGKRGIEFTTNSGPSKEYDFASEDESVRNCGMEYFKTIYTRWQDLVPKVWWGRFIHTGRLIFRRQQQIKRRHGREALHA